MNSSPPQTGLFKITSQLRCSPHGKKCVAGEAVLLKNHFNSSSAACAYFLSLVISVSVYMIRNKFSSRCGLAPVMGDQGEPGRSPRRTPSDGAGRVVSGVM